MAFASPQTAIAELRQHLERFETPSADGSFLPFDVPCIDEH
jgi:hypothetical protein